MKIDICTTRIVNINSHKRWRHSGKQEKLNNRNFIKEIAITNAIKALTIVQAIKDVSARKSDQITFFSIFLSVENGIKNVINVSASRTPFY
jgi:hypothetical protein